MNNIEGVKTIKSENTGKKVAIFAGVHGNEVCGVKAFGEVVPNLKIDRGEVQFVLGNLRAIERNVRQTDMNLNRVFRPDADLSDKEKETYEYNRSRELMKILDKSDYLLDIHSFSNKIGTPFIICEPKSFDVAKKLPFDLVSNGWDKLEPGGTDYYMNKIGKNGICVECGQHSDDKSVAKAKESVFSFLKIMGIIDDPKIEVAEREQRKVEVNYIYITKSDFRPSRDFFDFEPIKKGELIGTDGNSEIKALVDGYIIFCKKCEVGGKEAFLIGV